VASDWPALEALRGECQEVSKLVLGLGEEDFAPTVPRTPAWTVKELLGHMYRDVDRIGFAVSNPVPGPPDVDSVSYWRSYDPVAGAPAVAGRAREVAAGYGTGAELAAAWDRHWRATLERAAGADRGMVVRTFGPTLTLDELVKTRVVEITVHRMDMEHALGRKGWGTDAAISVVDDVLVGLLGQEPPAGLEWDVVDFIEAGTGRRPLTGPEREVLGPMAERFPLLG
jgi:uncharacterized protein (TIGR03083 family)